MRIRSNYSKKFFGWLYRSACRVKAWKVQLNYEIALWLEEQSVNISSNSVRLLLYFFVAGCSGYLFYHIVSSIPAIDNSPEPLARPSAIKRTMMPASKEHNTVRDDKVERIRAYLDSLSSDRNGKSIYDSLLKARPGLMDSLRIAEHYYYQSNK